MATLDNRAQFYAGKARRAQADHSARLQKRLQRKGTRRATRRSSALGQRERRLKLNTNHTLSKRLLATPPEAFSGLAALTGIRERTRRRTRRRQGKHRLPVSKQARRAKRHASQWAFAERQELLTYQAALSGRLGSKGAADSTRQACPRGGYTRRANRPHQRLLFACQQCHSRLHADLVGARNSALRTLVIRHDWLATGNPVSCPCGDGPRSQSRTPHKGCPIAVESGHTPRACALGSSDASSCSA